MYWVIKNYGAKVKKIDLNKNVMTSTIPSPFVARLVKFIILLQVLEM